jgi:hypothetical protein
MHGGRLTEALALEREPVSVVHQAIENGVGERRIADDLVPMFDRKLTGDHGRAAAVPILHDLQEIAPLLGVYGSKSPIVEDQEFDASQTLEEPRVMAIAAGEGEHIEESRQALIEDGAIIPTGLVAEGAGNPTLADTGQSSVTMPGVRRMRRSFTTRSILASGSRWRLFTAGFSPAQSTSSSSNVMAHSR